MNVFEFEFLFVLNGLSLRPAPLPRRNVTEVGVVARGLAVVLIFFAEMTTTRFFALESVVRHQFAQLQEVSDTAGLLELGRRGGAMPRRSDRRR